MAVELGALIWLSSLVRQANIWLATAIVNAWPCTQSAAKGKEKGVAEIAFWSEPSYDGHCTVAVAIRFAPKPDFSNAILHTFRNTLRVRPALGNTTGLDNHPGMFFLAALGCIPRLAGKLLSASAPSQAICPSTLSA